MHYKQGGPMVPEKYVHQEICIICGKPITEYSKDERKAKYEDAWKLHWDCSQNIFEMFDREFSNKIQ